jgi:16S rRNA (uracil1498-N3)-methyltransferase
VVVQALPKGDRAETAVETLTEVGVDVIVPWLAERCVARWSGEKVARGRARWEAVARAAGKQSRRARFPEVAPLARTADVAALVRAAAAAVVLHEEAADPLGAGAWPLAGDIVLVVGPEGGIAPAELEALTAAGARLARLGPTVLRTSTAGTVAAGVVLAGTARWS